MRKMIINIMCYVIKNILIGTFNAFNGRLIYNKSTRNDFIDGQIYYFFSYENGSDLIIVNRTKIYHYIIENEIYLDLNIPFSIFGKIMEKNGNIFVILSDIYEQVIFLNDKENIMKKAKINDLICFTESFIAERSIILGLVNFKNYFGDLLSVKYFNQENFWKLLDIYNSRELNENKNEIKE